MKILLLDSEYGKVFGEQWPDGKWFLHFSYKKESFKRKEYLGMLDEFSDLTSYLKSNCGLTEVYSCIPKKETKIRKFQTMFGLSPYQELESNIIYKGEL